MRKIFSVILMSSLCISLVGCGKDSTENNIPTEEVATTQETTTLYNLGDTVSTDIIEFNLESAEFAYYASSVNDKTYARPVEEATSGIFNTNKGHTFVCMEFSIKNTDRGDLEVFGWSGANMSMKVKLNGEEYTVMDYDLNNVNGSGTMSLRWSYAGADKNKKQRHESSNDIMDAGEIMYVSTLGQINTEPQSLTDPFELSIDILNSKGEYETFIYSIK